MFHIFSTSRNNHHATFLSPIQEMNGSWIIFTIGGGSEELIRRRHNVTSFLIAHSPTGYKI